LFLTLSITGSLYATDVFQGRHQSTDGILALSMQTARTVAGRVALRTE